MESSGRSRAHYVTLLGSLAALGVVPILGLATTPDPAGHGTHTQLGLPPCMSMKLAGIPCPGCGITTSVAHAGRGEWLASFVVQPFGFLIVAAALGVALWGLFAQLSGRDLSNDLGRLLRPPVPVVIAVLAAVSWIYKLVREFSA